MLKRDHRVDLIARAEDMVPAGHWLVIMVAADGCVGDKVLFLPDWASDDSSPLMLVVFGNGRTDEIVLKVVRIEDLIAKILKNVPMPVARARLYDGVDHAATETPILCVVGIGHYLEFLNGLDVGCKLPTAAGVAYGRAIQQEKVLSRASAINLVRSVHVPAARARKTARPEGLLRENDARCQGH